MTLVVLLSALLAASAPHVLACSCISIGDNPEATPSGTVVFRGKVVATELVVVGEDGNMFVGRDESGVARVHRIAVREVLEKFRGDIPPFLIIATGSGGGDCGYTFQTGKSYVIDANWTKDHALARLAGSARAVTTSICSLTAPESESAVMLQRLRKIHESVSPLFVR